MPRLEPLVFRILPLLAITASASAGTVPAALTGLWQVEDSACQGCDPARGAEAGAELRISGQAMQNPFGADCMQAVEVEALAPDSVAALQSRLGLPARWLTGNPADQSARPYRLSCAGRTPATLILLPNGALLLPTEASTVLRLLRRP